MLGSATTKLAQPFANVNTLPINTQLPLIPDSMIHHKVREPGSYVIVSYDDIRRGKHYGVSSSRRCLSPGLLLKRFHQVRSCLVDILGLSAGQREVVLRLLRYWAYYGNVYVKAAQVAAEPGCSKATYWRTLRLLRDRRLVTVINRFVIRPHAQISNLLRLDRLILLIARYLAEHGQAFTEGWLQPMLRLPGSQFWSQFRIGEAGVIPFLALPA